MLDIKKLKYLESIYKHKNFTRASEELYVSQPAISVAINSLEREMGVKLINRTSKEVSFTNEGEDLMPYVYRILNEVDKAEKLVSEMALVNNNKLNLGVSYSLSVRLIPFLYTNFFVNWTESKIHLDEGPSYSHLEKILDGTLDITFNAIPIKEKLKNVEVVPVTKAQVYVILNKDNPLTRYESIPFEALVSYPICMLDKKARITEAILENFKKRHEEPQIVSNQFQVISMLNMIKLGNTIGFINVDEGIIDFGLEKYKAVVRSLEEPIYLDVGFFYKKDKYLPLIAKEMMNFVKENLETWVSSNSSNK